MFNTILVANRGEIACRVIKTAQSMGIRTIAIYSKIDEDSLHVHKADSAYLIGEANAKDSYLNIEKIIEVAQKSGAEAIHPGYGFLSENPNFAKACEKAGLVFIGPSVEAIEAMASKQGAKQRLENTSVPLTPGYHGQNQLDEHLLQEAEKIGFPILIKAANGGGGKGMRAVFTKEEFQQALVGARRESMASFADDTMILEKLLLKPRHIEVQILADNFGNVAHLFERDCSIQRRHQKIIEEAPAPGLSDSLRNKLYQAACEVARSIHYRNAGTVEFLVDEQDNFYFMEMNTRLQVEHPVTELITGLDLVALQLKIAAGEPLPAFKVRQGHAIECRIYAEDPAHHFLPSMGKIQYLREPQGEGIRLDKGVEQGSRVSKYYDPMLAKLICFGDDRTMALKRMQAALRHYCIGGIKTNLPFLKAICHHPQFEAATYATDFLEKEELTLEEADKKLALLMAAGFDYLKIYQSISDPLFQETFAWPNNTWIQRYQAMDEIIELGIIPIDKNQLSVKFNESSHVMRLRLNQDHLFAEIDTECHHAFIDDKPNQLDLYTEKGPIRIERFNWAKREDPVLQGQLTAPMPSTVVAVLKNIGETVKAGERLIVLEAMKMEHTVHAPQDGILSEIFYAVGSQVEEGATLLALREP